MIDYRVHGVMAVGLLTICLCIALHSFFMFLVLELQVAYRRRCPRAAGI